MVFGEQFIESEKQSRIGACAECVARRGDFSEKRVNECELCGRWFCEKHIRPRTFLVRGLDDIQGKQIPEGMGLNDVPDEATPEQGTLMFGTSANWIGSRWREFKDKLRSRDGGPGKARYGDTHPDIQYTKKWLEELNADGRKRSEVMKRALGRMNHYYSQEKSQKVSLGDAEPGDKAESEEKQRQLRHFPTKEVAVLLLLLALAVIFWSAPAIISYLQRI